LDQGVGGQVDKVVRKVHLLVVEVRIIRLAA